MTQPQFVEVGYDRSTGEVIFQSYATEVEDGKTYTNEIVKASAYVKNGAVYPVPDCPGPGYVWHWAPTFAWVYQQDVADNALMAARANALSEVDNAAGQARLRYITSVPGQAETYTRKEQQARGWAADGFAGPAPSFIAAEADALGRSAQSVAEEVIGLADLWANETGPAIEAARRKWKVRIGDAATIPEIEAAQAAAFAELSVI